MTEMPPQRKPFSQLTGKNLRIKVVDIGANPIDGKPPYAPLMEDGDADIVGFEPNPEALAKLNAMKGSNETYLPYAIGDGRRHIFHRCNAPGMSSVLQPNPDVLRLFHNFTHFGHVKSTEEIETARIDDIAETEGAELIKMDIQGGELAALSHGGQRLANTLVIQTEVEFLPLYTGQPLFSDIELFLRGHGFMLHRFYSMRNRMVQPMCLTNDWHKTVYGQGLSQIVWADAIFIKDITRLERLSGLQVLKMAKILHDCYKSYDVVLHLLINYSNRTGEPLSTTYMENLGPLVEI
jgi:FkbM family methyltransferase